MPTSPSDIHRHPHGAARLHADRRRDHAQRLRRLFGRVPLSDHGGRAADAAAVPARLSGIPNAYKGAHSVPPLAVARLHDCRYMCRRIAISSNVFICPVEVYPNPGSGYRATLDHSLGTPTKAIGATQSPTTGDTYCSPDRSTSGGRAGRQSQPNPVP
jgi:hypothetical protein